MKVLIVLLMLGILSALAGAGFFMLRKGRAADPQGRAMARALTVRIALSVLLFLLVMLGWWLGWIKPTGIPIPA
jgi:hypothetical protein